MYPLNYYLLNNYKLTGYEYPYLNCWGLVVLWYKNELGIELDYYTDLNHKTMSEGEEQEKAHFKQVRAPSEGTICAFYDGRDILYHVGVYTHGKLLHTHKGGTKWESVGNAIRFQNVTVRYYDYDSRH